MVTRRKFLVATAATSLAPALPAVASSPRSLTNDEIELIDEELLSGLAETLVYEISDSSDIYGDVIDFGIRAVRLGDKALIWSFTRNSEVEGDGEEPKELLLLKDVVEGVGKLWWLYDCDENGIPEPDLTLRDVESLPDFTSVIVAYNEVKGRGIS